MTATFTAWDGMLPTDDEPESVRHIEGDVNMFWTTAEAILRATGNPTDGCDSGQGDVVERSKFLEQLKDLRDNYAVRSREHDRLQTQVAYQRVKQLIELCEDHPDKFFISYS
jgi:ElaB/YqjD/DUF883 family membrane-anchored ribosome-binding protein